MTPSYSQRPDTAPARRQKPGKTPQQKRVAAMGQQEATALSPDRLEELYAEENPQEDGSDEPGSADDGEDESPEDSDRDERDDDDPGNDPADGDWIGWPAPLAEPLVATPTLEPQRIYALRIRPAGGPSAPDRLAWRCQFVPPDGLNRALANCWRLKPGLSRVMRFLHALARWFETEKKAFLAEPCPQRFVAGERDFNASPIVTQQGLLARINESARMDRSNPLDEGRFSELAKNIWLVWPDKTLPLQALFTPDFQIAWVVEGCLLDLEPVDWRVFELSTVGGFLRQEKKALKEQSFLGLSQSQRLLFLCAQAGLAPMDGLKAVLAITRSAVPENVRA